MQIIESTPFGVRSSVMTMERAGARARFVLFPMIHLGAPSFYDEVACRLKKCDLVLSEGVTGRRTSFVTLAYRIAGRIRRFGLVDQGRGLRMLSLGVPVENVDATAAQFGRSWRRAPRFARILLLLAAPLFGLWLIVSGSRAFIARDIEVNDLPNPEDAFMPDPVAALSDAVVRDRDKLLCAAIAREADVAEDSADKTIGVVWGAGHMPAVTHFLLGPLGYHVAKAEWVTVFVP
ncbi:MAG TPA: hypothetical protein VED59_06190 [Acidimicrobiales bacterium]|nr:hypothetical protein [Acidimicrobiales bacterium]